jgi:hypothetical protein
MKFWGKLALAATIACVSFTATAMTSPLARDGESASALVGVDASNDALYLEHWIHAGQDNHGRPFVIVDKRAARIFVFAASGSLVGTSSTILGSARGDQPVPGAGQKDPALLLPAERKTPAGRFESQPGRNLAGETVVWVDYETGIAIHRVRPGRAQVQRLHSLATDATDDKRLSLGCVVVPEQFFASVVMPVLGHGHATVYVLPEEGAVEAMFVDPQRDAVMLAVADTLPGDVLVASSAP